MEDKIFAAPPTVRVGGNPYQIRYSHGSLYLLSCWGLDAHHVLETLNTMFQEGRNTEAMAKIAAAGLGTMDRDGNWVSLGKTPLEVSDMLRDGEAVELDKIAWQEFAKKHGLVMKTKEPTEPAQADPAQSGTGSGSSPSEQERAA